MDEMQKIQYAANSYYNRGLEMAKERNLSGAARFLKRALQFNKYHTDASGSSASISSRTETGQTITSMRSRESRDSLRSQARW